MCSYSQAYFGCAEPNRHIDVNGTALCTFGEGGFRGAGGLGASARADRLVRRAMDATAKVRIRASSQMCSYSQAYFGCAEPNRHIEREWDGAHPWAAATQKRGGGRA